MKSKWSSAQIVLMGNIKIFVSFMAKKAQKFKSPFEFEIFPLQKTDRAPIIFC